MYLLSQHSYLAAIAIIIWLRIASSRPKIAVRVVVESREVSAKNRNRIVQWATSINSRQQPRKTVVHRQPLASARTNSSQITEV